MFLTNCFLRNAPEKLWFDTSIIGYEPQYKTFKYNLQGKNLVLENGTWHYTDSDNHPNCIDCGENIRLFISLALMRDDIEELQWYVINGNMQFINNFNDDTQNFLIKKYGKNYIIKKATMEDIINYFKNNI